MIGGPLQNVGGQQLKKDIIDLCQKDFRPAAAASISASIFGGLRAG
jgi:hypothetical protein